jgi:hypothetical protein
VNIDLVKVLIGRYVGNYQEAMEMLKNNNRDWGTASPLVKEGIELFLREQVAEVLRAQSQP